VLRSDAAERARAIGFVAHILQMKGEFDEALRIRRTEELPVFEKLGDIPARALAQYHIAHLLLSRGQPADREEAAQLLRLALVDAERLRIPLVEEIREIQRRMGPRPE